MARSTPQRITLGIYGESAPTASKFFLSVCKGDYGGTSYDGSQVSKIQKDKVITVAKLAKGGGLKQETWMDEVGKVRIRSVNLAEKVVFNDVNSLRHDSPGVVSVPKRGGSFAFSIAPKANPSLDEVSLVYKAVTYIIRYSLSVVDTGK